MAAAFRPRADLGRVSPAVTQREKGEDSRLWRRVVDGVRENLKRNKVQNSEQEKKKLKEKLKTQKETRTEVQERARNATDMKGEVSEDLARPSAKEAGKEARKEGEGEGEFRSKGLDKRSERRLRRGEMSVDHRIDLHGLTREAAHGVLCMSLRRCYDRGLRCVLVISGKGRGVLREEVLSVLGGSEVRDIVVEHREARTKDGGEGARYVLLRRKRE